MAETKKESFRKYLESAGVIDSLTKGSWFAPLPSVILLLRVIRIYAW
jgi:hypothetical protein